MVVGRRWTALTSTVPGFQPVPEDQVVLVGARSLDAAEEPALRRSSITWLPPDRARDPRGVRHAVDVLASRVEVVHIHVDLDVHDPSIAPANGYAAADGLSALCAGLEQVMERGRHRKISVFRPLYAVGGQELGYLPGTESETMSPWAQAVFDTLGAVVNENVVEEMSRIGSGSQVVLTHDVAQRDNLRVGRYDGVTAVIEALKGQPLFAHVTLTRSERSAIAELVTELLEDIPR